MKDELAEALLAKVMNWGAAEVAAQRAVLQDLARYKYDEYQQFAPGQRFIESLALWLRQFEGKDARAAAYNWVRHRLIFLSGAEMAIGSFRPNGSRPSCGRSPTGVGPPFHEVPREDMPSSGSWRIWARSAPKKHTSQPRPMHLA